jgi:hypothetical protein
LFYSAMQIRQLALVELRKRVAAKKSKQWLAQPQELRNGMKARILEIILSETSYVLLIATAFPGTPLAHALKKKSCQRSSSRCGYPSHRGPRPD